MNSSRNSEYDGVHMVHWLPHLSGHEHEIVEHHGCCTRGTPALSTEPASAVDHHDLPFVRVLLVLTTVAVFWSPYGWFEIDQLHIVHPRQEVVQHDLTTAGMGRLDTLAHLWSGDSKRGVIS